MQNFIHGLFIPNGCTIQIVANVASWPTSLISYEEKKKEGRGILEMVVGGLEGIGMSLPLYLAFSVTFSPLTLAK